MEEKLLFLISKIKKANKKLENFFDLKFFKGEVIAIKKYKGNYQKIILKNKVCTKLKTSQCTESNNTTKGKDAPKLKVKVKHVQKYVV